jgi:ComF family protein
MRYFRIVLDVLYPERCPGCDAEGESICSVCQSALVPHPTYVTPWTRALFDYRTPIVRAVIHALKYGHASGLGDILGTLLYDAFVRDKQSDTSTSEDVVLIPIPAAARSLADRGYDQAERIAAGIARAGKKHGRTIVVRNDILLRDPKARSQVQVGNRSERIQNAGKLFFIAREALPTSCSIVLVDDVITTGATMENARKILRTTGIKDVTGIALAH